GPTGPTGPAGAALTLSTFNALDNCDSTTKTVVATCGGATTQVVSGGCQITNTGNGLLLSTFPSSATQWTCVGYCDAGFTITAYAICK
ncbi:MAG TPA: hypothetical protein PLK52_01645, partial [Usitatibacteraceae bacterium]|nr:hypothetical protein [Usitatibacteraceae bacterium]